MNNPYKTIYELRETIAELSERCREQEVDIEELLKEREWISAKNRLPDVGVPVLLWNVEGFAYVDTWSKFGCWTITPTTGEVTHWMPLPEPPKEE